jgi:septal ring factor EnvC (AmiA/AmiB activator)
MPAMRFGPGLPPVPRRNRRRTTVVLAALAAAFLLTAGVFAALFVATDGDHDAAVARADQRRGELADLDDRVSASDAERQRTEQRNTGLESENADLTECVDAMRNYLAGGLTEAERVTALDEAFAACQ